MFTDDLPWPELGNVSRGATRGNQGQKGVLGPPDNEGRCVLQLRVQPGILSVRLNRQASDWYRILDGEVNHALKLTKTYWRKARRRQDYDARADQDHMELHEWLQQLKDKTMSHLELLMQKGDIQGPPYIMPDHMEFTFLRKFIERQAAGIPHHPRLRNAGTSNPPPLYFKDGSAGSASPETESVRLSTDFSDQTQPSGSSSSYSFRRSSASPSSQDPNALAQDAYSSRQLLQAARTRLVRAQKDTQEAFLRYTACLEAERQARHEVTVAEQQRDELMHHLLSRSQYPGGGPSRQSSESAEEPSQTYRVEDLAAHFQSLSNPQGPLRPQSRPTERSGVLHWQPPERVEVYSSDILPRVEILDDRHTFNGPRKHSRGWDRNGSEDHQGHSEDLSRLPPRKRVQHMTGGGFDGYHNLAFAS